MPCMIKAQKLTQEAFKPYGDVIETTDASVIYDINEGNTKRYHDLAHIDTAEQGGHTLVNIFRSTPLEQPITIKLMERHPKSSQAFYPLSGNPYLVVVAQGGDFDIATLKVFLATPNQGVNYHKGTWHHYSLALNEVSDFLVIDRGSNSKDDSNCDEIILDAEQRFIIEY